MVDVVLEVSDEDASFKMISSDMNIIVQPAKGIHSTVYNTLN